MAFCTLLQWDGDFDFGNLDAMLQRSGGHEALPEGCLSRIVGAVDGGACVVEVWESPDDARRFAERSAPLLSEFTMPPPSRTAAFATRLYQTRP